MKKGEVVHTAYGDKVSSSRIPVRKVFRKHWLLLVMLIPAVVYVIIFCYVPMSGLVLAFEKYQYRGGWGSPAGWNACRTGGRWGPGGRPWKPRSWR